MNLRLDLQPKRGGEWPSIMRAIQKANPTTGKTAWKRAIERMGDTREWHLYSFCGIPIVEFELGETIAIGSPIKFKDLRK